MKQALFILVPILFISCINDDTAEAPVDFTATNEQEILDYIADNNLTTQKSDSGLYYVIDELGTGDQPTLASNVTVTYKGYFTNGTVFDESTEGIAFDLSRLITGFGEGVTYLKEGGNGTFIVPSRLAYGNLGAGSIPPGAVILFDVALISVN